MVRDIDLPVLLIPPTPSNINIFQCSIVERKTYCSVSGRDMTDVGRDLLVS